MIATLTDRIQRMLKARRGAGAEELRARSEELATKSVGGTTPGKYYLAVFYRGYSESINFWIDFCPSREYPSVESTIQQPCYTASGGLLPAIEHMEIRLFRPSKHQIS